MTIFIAHRINTLKELENVPSEYGIEIDIRDGLLVVHDPFQPGIALESLLAAFKHSFIILNIKCERIEYAILELLEKYKITEYFFLDSSFPMIYKLSNEGIKDIAIRYSEFETSVMEVKGMCKWVWVDSFNKMLSLNEKDYIEFKKVGFKLCFVSPELHDYDKYALLSYIEIMKMRGIIPDMVCTKVYNIEFWKNHL